MRHVFRISVLAIVWMAANLIFEQFIFPPAHEALHEGHLWMYLAVGWLGLVLSFPYLPLLRALNLSIHPAWFVLTSLLWGTSVYLLWRVIGVIRRRIRHEATPTA